MKTKLRRFVPRLFMLDDRTLPAVMFDLQGTFLFVTGDSGTNEITITDTGTDTGITVVGDGGEPFVATTPITHIFVDTQEGNDNVTYNLTASLTVFRLVDAQLGKGNDLFTANISGQSLLTADAELQMSVNGDGGHDTMVLNAQSVSTDFGSLINVFFDGDAGKDTITFDYSAAIENGEVFLNKDQRR